MRSVESRPRPEEELRLLWQEVAQQVCQLRDALVHNDQSRLQSLLSSLPSLVAQLEAISARSGGYPPANGDEIAASARAVRKELATCRQLITDRMAVVRWELRLLGALKRPAGLQTQSPGPSPLRQLDLRV